MYLGALIFIMFAFLGGLGGLGGSNMVLGFL
jgi:hypothetical protein